MIRLIGIVLAAICTSFFYFPFEFTFLPGINTKLLLSIIGLITFIFQLGTNRKSQLNKDFLNLSFIAFAISLIALISITINNTTDSVFVTYIISMWVWMAAAFLNLECIRFVHKTLTVELVVDYLILICVIQCILALSMDFYPPLKTFVDSFIGSEGYMGKVNNRLYGIGCSVDVAGLRFSGVLIMIAALCCTTLKELSRKRIVWYLLASFVILIIGNMISRTTLVGGLIAILYIIYYGAFIQKENQNISNLRNLALVIFLLTIPIVVLLYNNNTIFHDHLRFAFEGLFSLWELGEWRVSSNETLKQMIVFPDNMHSWIIGEGYFDEFLEDPNYIGKIYKGFGYYRNTDIGYLRYIFYFGVLGLISFITLFCKVTQICIKMLNTYRHMFLLLLIMNFIGWLKVSTDMFPAFALFLVMGLYYGNKIGEKTTSVNENHMII